MSARHGILAQLLGGMRPRKCMDRGQDYAGLVVLHTDAGQEELRMGRAGGQLVVMGSRSITAHD